ncbi:uncharacterized protein LOC123291881 isoform X2 [Chrysoperla carnea]|uniref:uncharacterized protein LOC123291881 isoform X2 n=1 Tax=Chrysoperla carnea TaxID=189513 RepID=UPI001D0995E8|nr:uncharacterized protein LOC123291881 isoform X2 [Chrysoperla carnea]
MRQSWADYIQNGVIITITLIFLANNPNEVQSFGFGDAVDVIETSYNVARKLFTAYETVASEINENNPEQNEIPLLKGREQKILRYVEEISRQMTKITSTVGRLSGGDSMENLLQQLPNRLKYELQRNDLANMITQINVAYNYMLNYVNDTQIERLTLEDFAMKVVSHDPGSVQSLLSRIHYLIVPEGYDFVDRGILYLINDNEQEANSDLCNLRQSPQQLLFNLYSTLALTELKGYSMMQFSYMLMKLYNKGNMTREVELMRKGYEDRTKRMIGAIKSVMQDASRDLWICDPKRHVPGESYIEVTQLLQGYVENEVDLNKDGTCRETCNEYSYTENYGCYKDLYCSKQRKCKGKIINCKYYDADMWICPSNASSGRRYDYIEYENGRVLGKKGYCQRGTQKVDSWWRWLFWRCSYCFCLCDEQGVNSDRYFNLRNVIADVGNNRVVTGLRFVKENRIIHLQIQQGELLPKGRINEATLEWVPVDKYSILDSGVVSGEDYHTLTWESRAIDLDDLETKPNHIVTGVRFRKVGSHLNFEIQARPFNFSTGLLVDPKNQYEWISNDNTDASLDNPRRQLRLNNPDVPTKFRISSAPDSQSNQFLHFTHTAIDKDAAQTTVPFLDAQSVVSQIPVPLSGAGIYHKGQLGSGGFIAPKIKTFDFTPYIIEPPNQSDSESEAQNGIIRDSDLNGEECIHNRYFFLVYLIPFLFVGIIIGTILYFRTYRLKQAGYIEV